MVKYSQAPEELFGALALPTRRKMFEHLSKKGKCSVSDLAKPLQISLPATLKQVRILEESGLVVCEKEGRTQYCSINRASLDQMVEWLIQHQQFWSASFDRLEKELNDKKK